MRLRVETHACIGIVFVSSTIPLFLPVIASPDQPCDVEGVDDVCPRRRRCGTGEWDGAGCVAGR